MPAETETNPSVLINKAAAMCERGYAAMDGGYLRLARSHFKHAESLLTQADELRGCPSGVQLDVVGEIDRMLCHLDRLRQRRRWA